MSSNLKTEKIEKALKQLKGIINTTQNIERKKWAIQEFQKLKSEFEKLQGKDSVNQDSRFYYSLNTPENSSQDELNNQPLNNTPPTKPLDSIPLPTKEEYSNDSTLQVLENFPTKVFHAWPTNYELNLINTFLHIWSNYFLVYINSKDMYNIAVFSKKKNQSYLVLEKLERKLILFARNLEVYKKKGRQEVSYREIKKNEIEMARRVILSDTSNVVNQLYDYWVQIYNVLVEKKGKSEVKDNESNEKNVIHHPNKFHIKTFKEEIKDIYQYAQTLIIPNVNMSADKSFLKEGGKVFEAIIYEIISFLREVQNKLLTRTQKKEESKKDGLDKILLEDKEIDY